MTTIITTGKSCGRVMSRNTRQEEAPSTWAASIESDGTAARPPMSTRVMKGTQPQTSAMTQTANASTGSESQPMSASGGRRMPKNASNRPNSGLNMKRNETPTRAGLMAKGRMSRVRTVNRSRPPGARSRATPRASRVVRPTVSTV